MYRESPVSDKSKSSFLRRLQRHALTQISSSYIQAATRCRVIAGPFKDLTYAPGWNVGNALYAKYCGIYERELHSIWCELFEEQFSTIIDVGSAEGYYVVGCARVFPQAQVIGFEVTEKDRNALEKLAELNGVRDRVQTAGWCDENTLIETLNLCRGKTLLIIDIEGGEIDLLTERSLAFLKDCVLIVETHDLKRPGCTDHVANLFSKTHNIRVIEAVKRSEADLTIALPPLLQRTIMAMVGDLRPLPQQWLVMTPGELNNSNQ
jgi:hypothetical protein